MADNRLSMKSGNRLSSSPEWDQFSVEGPLVSCHHGEKETRFQSGRPGNTFSGIISPTGTSGTSTQQNWGQTPRYCGASSPISSCPSVENHSIRYESSSSPQGSGYDDGNSANAPYPSTLCGNTVPSSYSSPGDMTEASSTIEASAPESPDAGGSDRDRNPNSRSHPKPFSRKSKAGNQHTVTPAAAGPEGGFICKFVERGELCGKPFKLPSDIRFHLIENHMGFSPFQCEKCMRVYTRKSLYTRHLKDVAPDGTTRRVRQCPHRAVEQDEAFRIRKKTYEALWAIQVTQDQVDQAINIIRQHNNGALPSRRRRTQNINGIDSETTSSLTMGVQCNIQQLQGQKRDGRGLQSQQVPLFRSQSSVGAYPSALARSSSAPDLFPPQTRIPSGYSAQDPTADPEVRRRPQVATFNSNQSFQTLSTYQNQQDASPLPMIQPPAVPYFETPLYTQEPRAPGFLQPPPPHEYNETTPTVNPHVLHQQSSHRHHSWHAPTLESNYDSTWAAPGRDLNYRPQMTYGSDGQGYKENYQYSTSPQTSRMNFERKA